MKILNVAVLFGGCSSEYKISLQSAYAVLRHMDAGAYRPVMIGISPEGNWYHYRGDPERIRDDTWLDPALCTPAVISPNRDRHELLVFQEETVARIRLDAALPVLHGRNGEDGTVQGIIELSGLPLVGCGTLSSALCMDKDRAHRLAQSAGVLIPRAVTVDRGASPAQLIGQAEGLGYPMFVKPLKAGSSLGVTKVQQESGLFAAADLAFSFDDRLIMEESIPGFEVGCAVMGKGQLVVGEVDEIQLSHGFFDFEEKYALKTSAIHVPARVSPEVAANIKDTAKVIYRALGCCGFARVDMFLTPSGHIVFNEVNTIPGFTAHSRFPNMMKAAGMPFRELISNVIEMAVQR